MRQWLLVIYLQEIHVSVIADTFIHSICTTMTQTLMRLSISVEILGATPRMITLLFNSHFDSL